jgi:hypothetical protein
MTHGTRIPTLHSRACDEGLRGLSTTLLRLLSSTPFNPDQIVGLLDGAMHVWAVLYRATRIKTLYMEGSHWNQGE